MTAVINRLKERNMITANAGTTENSAQPKATKKARAGAQRAHVAPAKGKSGKKASAPKKAIKKDRKNTKPAARKGSKTAQVLELLKRPGGATLQELMAATEWQPHSLRGFISGTLGKKMGLSVESAKGENGQRTYSLKS